ncbi:MAG: GatB/YqeY domain-containing protein [Proteiniphilum sp.]|nr:GatB/YqeY domain-containing protein [Proteiniphilum sp.]
MKLDNILDGEIKKAMLAKDRTRLDVLRAIKKEFIEAKTAKNASGEISESIETSILQRMVKQRKESAEIFITQNREDLAKDELAQLAILQEYLPEQLSPEALVEQISAIITSVGASSMKDMGKVMGLATKQLAGKAEGKAISDTVKRLLS